MEILKRLKPGVSHRAANYIGQVGSILVGASIIDAIIQSTFDPVGFFVLLSAGSVCIGIGVIGGE